MSHVTALKGLVMTDEAAIIQTINELQREHGLNVEILRNASVRAHGSSDTARIGKCDIVMKLKDGTYDVGFKKNAEGNFEPMFDIYGERVGPQVGVTNPAHLAACELPGDYFQDSALRQLGRFSQLYAKNAAMNQAAAEGYTVDSIMTDSATGVMQLVLNV